VKVEVDCEEPCDCLWGKIF